MNQSSLDFSKCQSSFFSHSPLDDSHQNYDTISSRGEDSEEENSINGGMETCRILKLRHQLGEHTAFLQENVNPAPVTSIRVTKDHKALLIGDGIGRVWMWNEP